MTMSKLKFPAYDKLQADNVTKEGCKLIKKLKLATEGCVYE